VNKKLPKEIFVVWDQPPNDTNAYLLAAEKAEEHVSLNDRKIVGCYRLVYEDEARAVPQFKRLKKR
jgi:hypothetical protein